MRKRVDDNEMEMMVGSIEQDMFDFDARDANEFENVGISKRLSCYAHTIQLVITTFNKDDYVKSLLKDVYKLIAKVNNTGN